MVRRICLLFALASLQLTLIVAQNATPSHYVYFADGAVEAYPEEFVKSLNKTSSGYELTLTDDTHKSWTTAQVDSVSKISPVYPQFTDFKLDDKLNDQLFSDVDGTIYADSVRLVVGAIGKWLTPSYKTDNNDAVIYVGKDEQTSGQSRRRYADDVVYTLSLPGHTRLAREKVSDEVWSEPGVLTEELPLTANMLSTNAPSGRNQGLDMLLDNDPQTFFHSTYSGDPVYDVLPLDQRPYVSVSLAESVSKMQFYYMGRVDSKDRNPHAFQVYASKDNKTWKKVAYFDSNDGIIPIGKGVEFTSPVMTASEPCRYWRFEATACNYKNYLCMSEFRLYEVVGAASEPELIQPAQYAYAMLPMGREVAVRTTWLTDYAEVPRVDIDIEGGKIVTSKDYYLNAEITIDGRGVWPDLQDVVQIKGRGNSSWGAAKKPYRLKFASSVKPFGMKKGKNWNLIAQAQTGSLLTNPVAHKIARMTGAAAAHDAIPCDLYMNGAYLGSYMFTQKVGLANNSVDLDDETQAVLIEFDSYSEAGQFRTSKYSLPTNIKSPDFSEDETVLTRAQIISDINLLTNAIYDNANYERYLDIDMLARFMLVNELVLNADLGHPKSTFLYRENMNHMSSRYTFGPAWDFDWGYGYEGSGTYCLTDPTEYYFDRFPKNPGRAFFMTLWETSDLIKYHYYFVWKDFMENHLEELIDYVDDYYAYACNSFKKNSSVWGDGYNYTTNVANMKSWLNTRAHHIMDSLTPYEDTKAPYHFGDSNSDGYIDEKDLESMLSYLYRSDVTEDKLNMIDVDLNGELTVCDIAWICTLMDAVEPAQARRLRGFDEWSIDVEDEREDSDDDELYQVLDNYAAQAMRNQTRAETINLSVAVNAEKQGWDITVDMANQDSYVAFQMDFVLPTGVLIYDDVTDITLSPRTDSTHVVLGGALKDGSYRVIVYSTDNDLIADTQGPLFTLSASLAHKLDIGDYPLMVKNIRMVKSTGVETILSDASADISVESDMTPIEFVLSFIVDGELFHVDYLSYSDTIVLPDSPIKEGYTFGGWSEIPEIMPTKDVIISGIFTINKYLVTFKVGDEVVASDSLEYKSTIIAPEAPEKEGHTFNGWGEVADSVPASDLTYEGIYTVNSYLLTYTVDGEVVKADSLAYGTAITAPEAPEKEGYTFRGWSEVPETMPAEDVIVSGIFTINKYLVTYKVGDDVIASDSLEYMSVIVAPEAPEKEGYTFRGWSEVPETMPAEDIIVSGIFTINKYLVTFMIGDEVIASDSLEYGAFIFPPEAPEKEGHTFDGWGDVAKDVPAHDVIYEGRYFANSYLLTYMVYGEIVQADSVAYGTAITAIAEPTKEGYTFSGWIGLPETMPANDITTIGTFSINKYLVTFMIGDEVIASDSLEYGAFIFPPEAPEKEGHTFNGWGEVAKDVPAHDVTYEGSYTVNTYNVYYYVGEELVHTAEVTYGEAIPEYVYEPTEEGYTFLGWIGDTYETMPAHDVTYTANVDDVINNLMIDNGQLTIYDLQGRKVLNTEKLKGGIYIINGKKVVIK